MIYLECPICLTTFGRYASQIASVDNPTCSYACAYKAKEVRVFKPCVVCGIEMEQTPSEASRVTTCGKRCSSIRRRGGELKPIREQGAKEYRQRVKEIQLLGCCARCGSRVGPWVVRGLVFDYSGEEPKMISSGLLWCRKCHLEDVASLGTPAREAKKSERERGQ